MGVAESLSAVFIFIVFSIKIDTDLMTLKNLKNQHLA